MPLGSQDVTINILCTNQTWLALRISHLSHPFKKLAHTHGYKASKNREAEEKRNGLKSKPVLLSISKEFVLVVKFQGNVSYTE